jgi:hypothetical protein
VEFSRRCRTCLLVKPFTSEFFHRAPSFKDGWETQCKVCKLAYNNHRARTFGLLKVRANRVAYKLRLREQMIAAYGGCCACCGETHKEFLQIDHVGGGGKKHRAEVGQHIAAWLRMNGWPKDKFRLLCANCNQSLGFRGYCPHNRSLDQNTNMTGVPGLLSCMC